MTDIAPPPPTASRSVLALGDGLQVSRVHAALHSTEMVHFVPVGDLADKEFVRQAMGHEADALVNKDPVAVVGPTLHPDPASLGLDYVLPEPVFKCPFYTRHTRTLPLRGMVYHMYLDLSSAPSDPIERLVWLSGLDQAVRKEINAAWQETYFEARLKGMFDTALNLNLHPRKKALAWTRHENEALGRAVSRWNDGF